MRAAEPDVLTVSGLSPPRRSPETLYGALGALIVASLGDFPVAAVVGLVGFRPTILCAAIVGLVLLTLVYYGVDRTGYLRRTRSKTI